MFNVTTELKEYQKETVKWLVENEEKYGGGMVLSDAGVGKTLTMIKKLSIEFGYQEKEMKKGSVLIVCPASLIKNWKNEFNIHTDIKQEKLMEYHGSNRDEMLEKSKADIIITSYNILEKDVILQRKKYNTVILDEAHYIRNTKTKMSKSVMNLQAKCKWILTATPFFNNSNDYFSYFKFMFGNFDNLTEWKREYNKDFQSVKKLNELIKKHSIQYKKKDVLSELPKKEYIEIMLDFSEIEREFYEGLRTYSEIRIKKIIEMKLRMKVDGNKLKSVMNSNILTLLLRLRQCCDSFQNIKMERIKNTKSLEEAVQLLKFYNTQKVIEEECPICYDESADEIADPCGHKCCKKCWKLLNKDTCPICRREINSINNINSEKNDSEFQNNSNSNYINVFQSSKIKKVNELINSILKKNEKVIIVSQWVTMLNLIKRSRLCSGEDKQVSNDNYITLAGDISITKRHENITRFQEQSECNICYISLMASAEGINLTAANHVILVDSWYNNSKMLQVSERVNRIGQSRPVNIYKLKIKNSIEEKLEKRVYSKSNMSKLIMSNWCDKKNENVFSEITNVTLLDE
jgi:DNA repair protein RAD5